MDKEGSQTVMYCALAITYGTVYLNVAILCTSLGAHFQFQFLLLLD